VKKNSQKNKELKVLESHKLVIDEWFANGFNQTQAVLKYNPELEYQAAATLGHLIINRKSNKPYIAEKHHNLSLEANITTGQVLKELKNFAFADITKFIGLDESEVKELPSEVRRTLKKVTVRTKMFKGNEGLPVTEKTCIYELHDKLGAIEKINRHIGFYAEDNAQRQPTIDLTKATPDQLNAILQLVESQREETKSLQ